jgi:hypothetical protein
MSRVEGIVMLMDGATSWYVKIEGSFDPGEVVTAFGDYQLVRAQEWETDLASAFLRKPKKEIGPWWDASPLREGDIVWGTDGLSLNGPIVLVRPSEGTVYLLMSDVDVDKTVVNELTQPERDVSSNAAFDVSRCSCFEWVGTIP